MRSRCIPYKPITIKLMTNLFSDGRNNLIHADQALACATWIKVLQALRTDNAQLIRQLADAVNRSTSRSFIEEAEAFQLKMLSREEAIVLLRHEIKEQLAWLEERNNDPAPHDHQALTQDVTVMVTDYENLKTCFLKFLSTAG